jgi:XTP/dITP diphosphohydrolase
MRKICFATNNANKVKEIQAVLGADFEVLSLASIGCTEELPETQGTIEGNSWQKAHYVWENYGVDCFADDTGLEVHALNNAPGVDSAHYAGPQRSDKDNMALLLQNLEGKANRQAHFKTVITLMEGGKAIQFEGRAEGEIITAPRGEKGFGYDPLFLPQGYRITFAEMDMSQKSSISHRAKAVKKLIAHLTAEQGK